MLEQLKKEADYCYYCMDMKKFEGAKTKRCPNCKREFFEEESVKVEQLKKEAEKEFDRKFILDFDILKVPHKRVKLFINSQIEKSYLAGKKEAEKEFNEEFFDNGKIWGKKEAIEECIKLSDEIEMREPDGGTREWMAFKAFRNSLRDKL